MRETTIDDHIRFYEDQVKIMEDDYRSYYNSPLSQLFQSEDAFYGIVVGINNISGHIIVKFRKNCCPRLKYPFNFVVLRSKVWEELGSDIFNWACTCKTFCETKDYHTDAARPLNTKLDKSNVVNAGFEPLPEWHDAVERYVSLIQKNVKKRTM